SFTLYIQRRVAEAGLMFPQALGTFKLVSFQSDLSRVGVLRIFEFLWCFLLPDAQLKGYQLRRESCKRMYVRIRDFIFRRFQSRLKGAKYYIMYISAYVHTCIDIFGDPLKIRVRDCR
ncbi:hypothetical protein H1C71_005206, partial [Ictidomys tridecemlineatus]